MIDFSDFNYTQPDGIRLYLSYWKPTETPKAVVNFVHGHGDHSKRYAESAKKFCTEKIAWMSVDLRGHGLSGGARGHISSFNEYLKDVDVLKEKSKNIFGNIPVFLVGHSMGGNIVLNYALNRLHNYSGVVASSPWIKLAFSPNPLKIAAAKIMKRLFPSFSTKTGLDVTALSRNKNVVEELYADPLSHSKMSTTAFMAIQKAGNKLHTNKQQTNTDILVMHGDADRITSHKASKKFVEQYKGTASFKSWSGYYHELFNDIDNHLVFAYLNNWIDEHASQDRK